MCRELKVAEYFDTHIIINPDARNTGAPYVVPPYQSDWQTATDRQQVCSTPYSTSRPVYTSQTQNSHPAQPLAATSLGLY